MTEVTEHDLQQANARLERAWQWLIEHPQATAAELIEAGWPPNTFAMMQAKRSSGVG